MMTPSMISLTVAGLAGSLAAVLAAARNRRLATQLRRSALMLRRRTNELVRATGRYDEAKTSLDQVRDALRLREIEYDAIFNTARDMIFVHAIDENDLPGRILDVNAAMCSRLGRSRDELLRMTPLDVEDAKRTTSMVRLYSRNEIATISDDEIAYRKSTSDRQLVKQILSSAEVQYERTYLTATGTHIPVEIRALRFDVDGRPLVLCTACDVTERRKSERALREGQQRLRDLLRHSPVGSAMYDGEGRLVDTNHACLRMFGCPDEAAFEKLNLFDNPFIPENVRPRVGRRETVPFEAVFDFDVVKRDGLFVSEKHGKSYFDILLINLGLDSEYRPKGYLFQIQDITQRRNAESALREKERQLRQSQKLEAIGSLASGIAHDFNNILTPVMGYAELALDAATGSETLNEYMSEVLVASQRARELIQQILTFSRQSEPDVGVPMRVTTIVKEVLKLAQTAATSDVRFKRVLRAKNDTVKANPVQIHQVLMNLCTNALHAMQPDGGELELTTANVTVPAGAASGLDPGQYLRVTIRDTGCGMTEDVREQVFNPFFTTKGPGEGTGMGLAVAHGIVTAAGGAITVDSTRGEGSLFTITLPVVAESAESVVASNSSLPGGSEHILVVDDEVSIRRMMQHMLRTLGYTVATLSGGAEALAALTQNGDRYDLLITDQMMPEMTGAELARQAMELRPGLPVILCTGFSDQLTAREAKNMGIAEFMTKPIVRRNLAESVRRALAEQGEGKSGGSRLPEVHQPRA